MKIAKLFAYLGISIFIPLWLFILMDTKLEEEHKDKNVFNIFKALVKIPKEEFEINPADNTTINQPFIQFTYSPQTTYRTNEHQSGIISPNFPDNIKIDPQSFLGMATEIENLRQGIKIDTQFINRKLDDIKKFQKDLFINSELNKKKSTSYLLGFSENKPAEVWEIQLNDSLVFGETITLILKNTSQFYTASIKPITNNNSFNIVKTSYPRNLEIPPEGKFVLEYYYNNAIKQTCTISLTFHGGPSPPIEGYLTLIVNK
jgi:hypothetical protein